MAFLLLPFKMNIFQNVQYFSTARRLYISVNITKEICSVISTPNQSTRIHSNIRYDCLGGSSVVGDFGVLLLADGDMGEELDWLNKSCAPLK
jgi:hypothetical protein